MESITGVVVCDTASRRTTVRNTLTRYARKVGLNDDPQFIDIDSNKYGVGPTVLIMMWFGQADDPAQPFYMADAIVEADDAWATMTGINLNWVRPFSFMEQQSETGVKHRQEWVDDGQGGVERVTVS